MGEVHHGLKIGGLRRVCLKEIKNGISLKEYKRPCFVYLYTVLFRALVNYLFFKNFNTNFMKNKKKNC